MVSLNTGQQKCNVGKLPPFNGKCSVQHDIHDRFQLQAIVPAYTFNCSGIVTKWRACVQNAGSYFIYFQIWRPTITTEGCYVLVGNNTDKNDAGEDVPFRSVVDTDYPCCIVLPVKEERQIMVQSGDVVGYYVDGVDRTEGGLQWANSNEVTVYYKDGIGSEDIKTHYAVNGLSPSNCWPHISDINNSFSLLEVTTAAPIISLEFGKLYNYGYDI